MKIKNYRFQFLLLIACFTIISCEKNKDEGKITIELKKYVSNCDKAVIRMWGYAPLGDTTLIVDTVQVINGSLEYKYSIDKAKNLEIEFLENNKFYTKLYFFRKKDKTRVSSVLFIKNENILINANSKTSGFPVEFKGKTLRVDYDGSQESDTYFEISSKKITPKIVKSNNESFAVLYQLFWQKESKSSEELSSLMGLFSDKIKITEPYKILKKYLDQKNNLSKIGYKKSFLWSDVNGNKFNYDDVIKDKKYVLLVFWASWCAPCIAEIPELKKFNLKFKDKVALVSLSIDSDYDKWKAAVEKEKIDWHNLSDLPKNKLAIKSEYNISAIPTLVLLDTEGKELLNTVNDLQLITEYINTHE
ncbi:TlpA disulfide reductase family protein [Daejeonella sp.]|uniref:TlpA family protein disulfide reductase n=1 Tax=Daejeonella sp. TaxID=2805397 RepID=UPI0025BEA334|nr:TlpA disulfide reductase family protein [Daejeonella sp.]